MTTQTLSSVAVHVVGQYNEAGKTLVSAYRTGAHRVLGGVASRLNSFSRVQKATDFLANRLDIDTSRVVNVMDRVAAASTHGIEAVAGRVAQVESPVATSVMTTMTALNMPVYTLSAKLADKVVEGARAIEGRVAGSDDVVSTVKAKASTGRRAVRKAA